MAVEQLVDRTRKSPYLATGTVLFGLFGALILLAMPAAAEFPLAAKQTAVGAIVVRATHERDTLMDVGRRYDLGLTQIMAANSDVDPRSPGDGRRIMVPNFYLLPDAPHSGLVINPAEQRLYYFPPGQGTVETFPIGTPVRVVSQDVRAARIGDEHFVEVHPTKDQGDQLDIDNRMTPAAPPVDFDVSVTAAAGASDHWSANPGTSGVSRTADDGPSD
jgi:hypothetical protein